MRMDAQIRHATQRHGRQERRLRAGLSVLTSGVHLGLTIQYRDHVAGQILQTVGGMGTSVLLERAFLRHQGISGLPDVLISMAVLPPRSVNQCVVARTAQGHGVQLRLTDGTIQSFNSSLLRVRGGSARSPPFPPKSRLPGTGMHVV